MHFTAQTALFALLVAVPAWAQDVSQSGVEIETNLFCDTQQQVERFVTLFRGDSIGAEAAIAAVNAENKTNDACVIATAAYRPGESVSTVKNGDVVFDVMRITVVGVYTINGLEQAAPTELFTLMPRTEEGSDTVGQR